MNFNQYQNQRNFNDPSLALVPNRCPSCHRLGDSIEFYRRHLFQLSVTVWFTRNYVKVSQRNFKSLDFTCPWEGCQYHNCDSLVIEGHILHCKFAKV